MSVLDSVLNKTITAWRVGGSEAVTLGFEDGSQLSFDPHIDEDDDVALTMIYLDPDETEVEVELEEKEPSQSDRYANLTETVQNVYSHRVEINTATGALVCKGCQRENAELAEEPCP